MTQSNDNLTFADPTFLQPTQPDQPKGIFRWINRWPALFWLSIPLSLLVLSAAVAQIIVAASYVPRLPKEVVAAYNKCINLAKTSKDVSYCKPPTAPTSTAAKAMTPDKWIVIGAIALLIAGVIFSLIRYQQDISRLKEIASVVSVFVSKDAANVPSTLLDVFQSAASKLGNDPPVATASTPISPKMSDGGH